MLPTSCRQFVAPWIAHLWGLEVMEGADDEEMNVDYATSDRSSLAESVSKPPPSERVISDSNLCLGMTSGRLWGGENLDIAYWGLHATQPHSLFARNRPSRPA